MTVAWEEANKGIGKGARSFLITEQNFDSEKYSKMTKVIGNF